MSVKELNRRSAGVNHERPVKVLQFGEGNFLRAFTCWIIDLLNEKAGFNGDVQIVQPLQNGMAEVINQQEGLYHTYLAGIREGKDVNETRLITSVRGVLNPYADYGAFLKLAENPELQFVISNTTEAGISFNPSDVTDETLPESFAAKLTAFLHHRYKVLGPDSQKVHVLPCELIEKNGEKLGAIVQQYAALWELPLAFRDWLNQQVIFYNTLVDRIVPGFPKNEIEEIQSRLGYSDRLVVQAEPFYLWVIEASSALREALLLDKVSLNIQLVDDLTPYRSRKVRILNGLHTAMVPMSYLKGHKTVRETLEDPDLRHFLDEMLLKEIIPILPLPEEELKRFSSEVTDRFLNPYIAHQLMSISLNGISKFKVRVLPSILDYYARYGELPDKLMRCMGYLLLFYRESAGIELKDNPEYIRYVQSCWRKADLGATVHCLIENQDLWGTDLTQIPGFTHKLMTLLSEVWDFAEDQPASHLS